MTKRIAGAVWFTAEWFKTEYGIIEKSPFEYGLDEILELDQRKNRFLYDRYPDMPFTNKNYEPILVVPQHDGRNVVAVAYGAPYPRWEPDTQSYWYDRSFVPWRGVSFVEDALKIDIPDWNKNILVQEMITTKQKVEEYKKRNNVNVYYAWTGDTWSHSTTNKTYIFSVFMSFIDMGSFLLGTENFFSILASDKELSHALLDKCFEISTSYSDFMRELYGAGEVKGLSSFGGDFSCVFSPSMYKEYAIGFDKKLIEKYGDLPANLHSCGPSSHLYDVWTQYPNPGNIVLMQTRGIEGELNRLRKALPHTYLQITIHNPQFDFEHESSENVKRLVQRYAEESERRDLQLTAIVSKACGQADENIRTFYKTIDEINLK